MAQSEFDDFVYRLMSFYGDELEGIARMCAVHDKEVTLTFRRERLYVDSSAEGAYESLAAEWQSVYELRQSINDKE